MKSVIIYATCQILKYSNYGGCDGWHI